MSSGCVKYLIVIFEKKKLKGHLCPERRVRVKYMGGNGGRVQRARKFIMMEINGGFGCAQSAYISV